jgi:DNA-directed primase/polymerase protein
MTAVPPSRFYGPSPRSRPFIPPVLRRSAAARAAVLASKRAADPGGRAPFRTFPTQALACACADAALAAGTPARVWAVERDAAGRRRFLVASASALWRWYRRALRRGAPLHVYEVIRRGAACKMYFDLEFARGEGAHEGARRVDGDALAAEVVRVAGEVAEEWAGCDGGAAVEDRVELLSSTAAKYSAHLVFPGILLRDNAAAGVFARAVAARLPPVCGELGFVDLAVYTPNRCFRLAGSSKFGRTQRLLPPLAYAAAAAGGRASCSDRLFFAALVTELADDTAASRPFVSVPLDAGAPERGTLRRAGSAASPPCGGAPPAPPAPPRRARSDWPRVDEYVLRLVGGRGGSIYGVSYFAASATLSYAIKGNWRYCARIGRHHRSNNVVLVASIARREMHQRCFDPDCRDFRSEPWPVPPDVLPPPAAGTAGGEDETQGAEQAFDDELAAFMDAWEASRTTDGNGGRTVDEQQDCSGGIPADAPREVTLDTAAPAVDQRDSRA